MGCVLFHLVPNPVYLALQSMFQSAAVMRFNRTLSQEIERELASLRLTVRDESGITLTALGVDVTDFQAEMPDEPIQAWLIGMDREPFEHYFPGE